MKLVAISLASLLCLEMALATLLVSHPFVLFTGVIGAGFLLLFRLALPRFVHLLGFVLGAILLGLWWQMLSRLDIFAWPYAAAMGVQVYALAVALAQIRFPDDERLLIETNWVFGISFGMAMLPVYLLFAEEGADIALWLRLLMTLGFAVSAVLLLEFTREANPSKPLARNPVVLLGSLVFLALLTLVVSAALLGASASAEVVPAVADRVETFVAEWKGRRDRGPSESPGGTNEGGSAPDAQVRMGPLEDDLSLQDELTQTAGDSVFLEFTRLDQARALGRRPLYLRKRARDRFEGENWTNTRSPESRRADAADGRTDGSVTLRSPSRNAMEYRLYYNAGVDRTLFHIPRLESASVPELIQRGDDWYLLPQRQARKVQVTMRSTPLRFEDLRQRIEIGQADDRYYLLPDTDAIQRMIRYSYRIVHPEAAPLTVVRGLHRYLRENYTYSLKIKRSGRPDRTRLEDFLFHTKTGYCTYYATSLAVLLRCRGIPSRVAFGYAVGSPVPGRDERWRRFDGMHAHAWTEVFIKDVGWVVLDATPSNGIPRSPSENEPPPPPDPSEFQSLTNPGNQAEQSWWQNLLASIQALQLPPWFLPLALFLSSLLLLATLTWPTARKRKRKANPEAEPTFFRQFCHTYAKQGAGKKHGQTPMEYLNALKKIGLVKDEFDGMIHYYYDIRYANAPRDTEREREFVKIIKGKGGKACQNLL